MNKNCPFCGEEINENAKKCKHCGEWLTDDNPPQKTEAKKEKSSCLGCFFTIIIAVAFIYNVGQILFSTYDETTTAPKTVETKSYAVGEDVKVGYMRYKVYSSAWRNSIGNMYLSKKPNAMYLIVQVSAKNEDKKSRLVPDFELVDGAGNSYESDATASAYLGDEAFIFESLNPNVSKRGYVVFDVPQKENYKLKISGGYHSSDETFIDLNRKINN